MTARGERLRTRGLLAALVAVALVAAACGDDDGNGGFVEEFREQFMESCTEDQPEAFCECYLEELEQRYTQDEIFRVAVEGSDEPPQGFVDAGFACIRFLD